MPAPFIIVLSKGPVHLAVPPSGNTNQGSIALRVIRSVRSLARIGSWAQHHLPMRIRHLLL
jgi:hypothetical protein